MRKLILLIAVVLSFRAGMALERARWDEACTERGGRISGQFCER